MTATTLQSLDVCNDALILVESGQINSITDPSTPKEVICARMYDLTIADLMSRHDWTFVNKLRQLQVDAGKTPDFNYTYAYRLPSDLVAGPFAVYAEANFDTAASDYRVQDDYVHADYSRVDVLYRASGADPSTWPAYFRAIATVALASRLAKPIAANVDLQEELRIEAFGNADGTGGGGILQTAKRLDAQTKPVRSLFANGDPLTTARLGGLGAWPYQNYKLPE